MSARTFAVMTAFAGAGGIVLASFVVMGTSRAVAQVRQEPPSVASGEAPRVEDLLPPGVETRAEATARLTNHKPDPVRYPVPRTPWDGKPDFSGVYWPDAQITSPPVALEPLYRPEAREYREAGGAARGLIDWRGIDSPAYHCWPPSPIEGSMAFPEPVQLVSAPGFLLMFNEGGGYFRIIPIVGEDGRPPDRPRKPSFLGSSVGHWEGDTLVVEVTNFNGKPWLGRARPPLQPPQTSSDALRIVERWSRPDGQTFEYQPVVEDRKMLTAPWTGPVHRRGILPYDMIQEAFCFPDPALYARHREYAEAARKKGAPGPGRR